MGTYFGSCDQVLNKLREAEILLSQGATAAEASRKVGVTEQTYYRWRKEYGGMQLEQAKRLKELEKENSRLKKLIADLSLDTLLLHGEAPKRKDSHIGQYSNF